MTDKTDPDRQQDPEHAALDVLREILDEVRALRSIITPVSGPGFGAASKTEASIRMVALQMLAGQDLAGTDEFWLQQAQRQIDQAARDCGEAIDAAVAALIRKRYHPAQARTMAIAVLLASHHPALRHPLLALGE
jgi:hypothetical protein